MNYPLLNVFLTTMWFFLWILWFFLLFRIFGDIFRDHELSGWGKAAWSVFVIVLPFVGVFVYLIARGRGMGAREVAQAQRNEQEFRAYVREAAGTGSGPVEAADAKGGGGQADQLAKLADLRAHGDISEEEFQRAKEHVLAA
ncbi:SHOCT domain-containing protein [Actinospica sp. MGRD01-02]|uniref:SHOCT domain-containing protein n=1 Tax=Actinospica acidithermotolerans TaxID=2828514 RepID=A0A941EAB1_9ACTN|nr:SHOCT domain-containing protein [Actinospica acidithermotolerans]MBR7826555.1 SHOCT domain-containing protein [Actinospica acidithermotolerans]